MSNRYREALTHLNYGVQEGGGFVLLTGEVGTGKTTVCRCLLQQLPDNTRLAFVLNPKLNSLELLATICDELKIEYPENCQSLKILTDKLSEYLLDCYRRDLIVVVMIDEAQNLESEVLEQIRLLTNLETNQKKLLQIILVGQPELQEKLAQRELRQLAQRITARYHLRPLNLKETIAYVLHRTRIAGSHQVLFSRSSIEYLHAKTQGIPRLINTICERALLGAASRKKGRVDKRIMSQAVKEIMGEPIIPEKEKRNMFVWVKATAAIVLLLSVAGFSYWVGHIDNRQVDNGKSVTSIETLPSSRNISADEQGDNGVSKSMSVDGETSNRQIAKVESTSLASQSLLEKLIGDQLWDNNGRWSFQQLLSLWQIEYSPVKDGDACEFAAEYGLKCNHSNGQWQQLRRLNRPALLKFSAGLQGEFWGILKRLQGFEAIVVFGNKESKISLSELSTIWTGEFILLWQAPEGYLGDIKFGDRGEAVYWLSQSLNWLNQSSKNPQDIFDDKLKQQLTAYQSQRNIDADGIAGMQTILKINAEILVGIPLLESVN
ncbi:AAA family ATPase [Aliikangiella coralliicola]|nr:AAA family ATPase [Aliikangiella coralliicola]